MAVREIGAGKKDVVTICVDELAMEGFKLLEEKKVSALAVVNNDGQLVGEMDSNSLKMIGIPACLAANVRLHATRLLAARSSAAELLVDSHSFS